MRPKLAFDPRPLALSSLTIVLGLGAVSCTERVSSNTHTGPAFGTERFAYPESERGSHVDEYHGVRVPDPYRWLEEPDSDATRDWIADQNELTFGYLGSVPTRERIHQRMTELWNYERYGMPSRYGDRYFFRKNDGLQNQSVLYVTDSLDGEARMLLDPNTLSEDGTISLANTVPSEDGRLLAYGLSDGGSDWRTWHVMNADTGERMSDVLRWNKFGGVAWSADSSGLFYSRYDEPTEGAKLHERNAAPDVYFHRLGTQQSEDRMVAARPEAEGISQWFTLTDDRAHMLLLRRDARTRKSEIDVLDLGAKDARPKPLVSGYDAQYYPVGGTAEGLFVRTNLDAPRWRVVRIDPSRPDKAHWVDVVPQAPEAIRGVSWVGSRLVVSYLEDATSLVRVFDAKGKPVRDVELPGIGTASGFGGHHDDPETFYSFTTHTNPGAIYRYDVATGETRLFKQPSLRFDPDAFETKQVFYESKDGTKVPMFITHRRGLRLDGSNPTYLYGYGGFNVSLTPSFSVANLVWCEMGGVVAIPNLRGGGEYGEAWHEAGTKLKKQNVFDDFIAAAEWLIGEGYTSPNKLAIGGGSNGGLLVGACMTQRPELFGATLPAVGVMDMLRYHKFTIGWAWAGDYGTSDDPDEFRALHAYSPLHNIEPGTAYPATLVTTGDHDDRVVPAHSFKFAAALQAAQAGPDPVLIRIETRAGHGAGKPTAMRIDEAVDRWAFLVRELDMAW